MSAPLKAQIERLSLTQSDVATLIGSSQPTVSYVLNGQTDGTLVNVDRRARHIQHVLSAVERYGVDAVGAYVREHGPLHLESQDDVIDLSLERRSAA